LTEIVALNNSDFDLQKSVEKAVSTLRDGKIIIAPLEYGYVLLCDAFNHGAVRSIHRLRNDARGVATQVVIGDASTARGLARDFGSSITALCQRFWPGLLTVNISAAQGLVWDLGDARTLEQISLRVPHSDFVRSVASQAGPLAAASASIAGQKPTRDSAVILAAEREISTFFDGGELPEGPHSTVISVEREGVFLVREGAITLTELKQVEPNIALLA
jgi:tRNA threonylcarbamoyl adenosine modification protein (Sua5/YciO/YrdC/YwlC family)